MLIQISIPHDRGIAAHIGAITMSGGGFQFVASEEPITTAAMNTAMVKAGKVVGKYKAPNV
jgi:hypothetical protein